MSIFHLIQNTINSFTQFFLQIDIRIYRIEIFQLGTAPGLDNGIIKFNRYLYFLIYKNVLASRILILNSKINSSTLYIIRVIYFSYSGHQFFI